MHLKEPLFLFKATSFLLWAGLMVPLSSWAHEAPAVCIRALSSTTKARNFEPADKQIEYIRQIKLGNRAEQAQAMDSLYANYRAMIEGMAQKHARLLKRATSGDYQDYVENFTQVGRIALFEAAKHYKLEYPKPGTYLHRYVYFFMLDALVTRDGQFAPPVIVRRMSQPRRRLLFSGRLAELHEALQGNVSMETLKDLHAIYSTRLVSLNEYIMDEQSSERIDMLVDTQCELTKSLRTGPIHDLVSRAKVILTRDLSERDRKIADARTFCDSEDILSTRDLADHLGFSHETVRLTDLKIKSKLKEILCNLLVNQTQFLESLTDDEADIARDRIFAKKKKTTVELADWLGWSEKRVTDTEKQIVQRYNYELRQQILDLLRD